MQLLNLCTCVLIFLKTGLTWCLCALGFVTTILPPNNPYVRRCTGASGLVQLVFGGHFHTRSLRKNLLVTAVQWESEKAWVGLVQRAVIRRRSLCLEEPPRGAQGEITALQPSREGSKAAHAGSHIYGIERLAHSKIAFNRKERRGLLLLLTGSSSSSLGFLEEFLAQLWVRPSPPLEPITKHLIFLSWQLHLLHFPPKITLLVLSVSDW